MSVFHSFVKFFVLISILNSSKCEEKEITVVDMSTEYRNKSLEKPLVAFIKKFMGDHKKKNAELNFSIKVPENFSGENSEDIAKFIRKTTIENAPNLFSITKRFVHYEDKKPRSMTINILMSKRNFNDTNPPVFIRYRPSDFGNDLEKVIKSFDKKWKENPRNNLHRRIVVVPLEPIKSSEKKGIIKSQYNVVAKYPSVYSMKLLETTNENETLIREIRYKLKIGRRPQKFVEETNITSKKKSKFTKSSEKVPVPEPETTTLPPTPEVKLVKATESPEDTVSSEKPTVTESKVESTTSPPTPEVKLVKATEPRKVTVSSEKTTATESKVESTTLPPTPEVKLVKATEPPKVTVSSEKTTVTESKVESTTSPPTPEVKLVKATEPPKDTVSSEKTTVTEPKFEITTLPPMIVKSLNLRPKIKKLCDFNITMRDLGKLIVNLKTLFEIQNCNEKETDYVIRNILYDFGMMGMSGDDFRMLLTNLFEISKVLLKNEPKLLPIIEEILANTKNASIYIFDASFWVKKIVNFRNILNSDTAKIASWLEMAVNTIDEDLGNLLDSNLITSNNHSDWNTMCELGIQLNKLIVLTKFRMKNPCRASAIFIPIPPFVYHPCQFWQDPLHSLKYHSHPCSLWENLRLPWGNQVPLLWGNREPISETLKSSPTVSKPSSFENRPQKEKQPLLRTFERPSISEEVPLVKTEGPRVRIQESTFGTFQPVPTTSQPSISKEASLVKTEGEPKMNISVEIEQEKESDIPSQNSFVQKIKEEINPVDADHEILKSSPTVSKPSKFENRPQKGNQQPLLRTFERPSISEEVPLVKTGGPRVRIQESTFGTFQPVPTTSQPQNSGGPKMNIPVEIEQKKESDISSQVSSVHKIIEGINPVDADQEIPHK